jgi:hypothetical protein
MNSGSIHDPIRGRIHRLAETQSKSDRLLACAVTWGTPDAAEIRPGPEPAWSAVLEGKIEPGDLDKLRNFVLHQNGAHLLYLASPGGDLIDAMKVGRFLRALNLSTVIPSKLRDDLRDAVAAKNNIKDPKSNYMCASACFFIFIAGIHRSQDALHPLLGIHKPYLPDRALKLLSGNEAIATASRTRLEVENYLREMSVPQKYADQMFAISKDEIAWISDEAFDADFSGFIPELKDWVDAKCNKLSEVERKVWQEMFRTHIEPADEEMRLSLWKKHAARLRCELRVEWELRESVTRLPP